MDKKKANGKVMNLVAGSLLLLIPKCGMCWAAYMGIFGLAGVSALSYRPWFLPAAILIFCLTLAHLLWRAVAARNYFAFLLAVLAALLLGWEKWSGSENGLGIAALSLMSVAWLIDLTGMSGRFRFTRPPVK